MSESDCERVRSATRRARELTLQMWETDDRERARELFREIRQLHLGIESLAMRLAEQQDGQRQSGEVGD